MAIMSMTRLEMPSTHKPTGLYAKFSIDPKLQIERMAHESILHPQTGQHPLPSAFCH